MKYATECKEVTIRSNELNNRSEKIIEMRQKITQPMKFYDDYESSKLIEPMIFDEK